MNRICFWIILIAIVSCESDNSDELTTNRFQFIDEIGDSLNIEIDGPYRCDKLNSILNANIDSVVYSTNNLYLIKFENFLSNGLLVNYYEQKQIYEDSTFIYTKMRKGDKFKRWYKSWRNPDKSRYPIMKTDTLIKGREYVYWFYLDYLDDGDSLEYSKTFELLDSSGLLIQFGATIKNGKMRIL